MIPIRKRDICKQQLRKMCREIADGITDPDKEYWNDAGRWMQNRMDNIQ